MLCTILKRILYILYLCTTIDSSFEKTLPKTITISKIVYHLDEYYLCLDDFELHTHPVPAIPSSQPVSGSIFHLLFSHTKIEDADEAEPPTIPTPQPIRNDVFEEKSDSLSHLPKPIEFFPIPQITQLPTTHFFQNMIV